MFRKLADHFDRNEMVSNKALSHQKIDYLAPNIARGMVKRKLLDPGGTFFQQVRGFH
jgi:hypothetical protein